MVAENSEDTSHSISDLNESERAILSRLSEDESPKLTGGEIAQPVPEMSTNNANWHLRENLEPKGYVEKVGTRDDGYPTRSNLWSLTDSGERIAQDCSIPPTYEDLQQRVRVLERRVDELEELQELETEVEEMREEFGDKVNELIGIVRGE